MTSPPTEPHSLSGAVIRPAVIADAPAIRGIRNAAVRDSLAIWTSREQDPDEAAAWLEPRIARGTALVIAGDSGRSDKQVVGFAVASPWHPYDGYARTVEDSIYLSPAARGRGLGTGLRRSVCMRRRDSPSSARFRPPGRSTVVFSTSPSCPGGSTGRDSAEPRHPASCGSPSR